MRAELAALSRILAVVNRAALWIAGIGLVAMTLFVAWQVFGRYVLNQSPSWTEPASLLLMSWFILLGSAVGVREGNHLGFEIALHYAPHGLRQIMLAVTEVLVMLFGAAMAWYGTALAVETWSALMPGLPIPQGFDYVPLAVGGVLIALFSLEKLVRLLLAGEEVPLVRADEPRLAAVKE
ncbi:TRAP transporter small permease [Microvirga calopogonii]|uniref:TRAP transporter small permease n=1 Tax=Microvirga calopogonii TaxID=2078013 RepID=UPI000E0D654D|nr:TRAP transporter small permease [Microvirga calopogonii]